MGWCFQLSTRLHDTERWMTKINLWHKDLKKEKESRRKPPLLSHSSASLKKGDLERLLFLKVSSLPPFLSPSLPLHLSILPSFPSKPSSSLPSSAPERASQRRNFPRSLCAHIRLWARRGARSEAAASLLELGSCGRNCASHFICAFPRMGGREEGAGANDKVGLLQFWKVLFYDNFIFYTFHSFIYLLKEI